MPMPPIAASRRLQVEALELIEVALNQDKTKVSA